MTVYIGTIPKPEVDVRLDSVTGILSLEVSAGFAQDLRKAVASVEYLDDGADHAYVTTLRRLGYRILPRDLLRIFEAVRAGALAPTALVLRGLPFDLVSAAPTPWERIRDRKLTDLSENLLVMMGALLGEPYGLAGEGTRLVNNLIPTQNDRGLLTGNGSELRLGYHTENAAHRWLFRDRDLSPSGLLLSGVCAPAVGAPLTRIANGRMAATKIERKDYESLRMPCVELALPLRQRRDSEILRAEPSPILSGRAGLETVTAAYYGDMMRPVSGAEKVVAAYEAAIESSSVAVAVTPGVMVYVPNGYSLHARDAFTPTFDAEGRANRWLQRIFVTARLDAFRIGEAVSERVFELPR